MTGRRTHALAVALTLAAATLSACGGSGEEEPTTQSVEEYAQTEAAKSTSRSKPAPSASGSTTEADSTSEAGDESPAPASRSATDDPPPVNQPTDKAQVVAATRFVKAYLDTFNKAVRKPSTRNALDRYTAPECKSCAALKSSLGRYAAKKQRLQGDGLVYLRTTGVETTDARSTLAVFADLKQPATKIVDEKGNHVGRMDGSEYERAFEVRSTGKTLQIVAIKKSL